MKNRLLIIVTLLMVVFTDVNAQDDKSRSLLVGFSPIGYTSFTDSYCTTTFHTSWGVDISKEWTLWELSTLLAFSYTSLSGPESQYVNSSNSSMILSYLIGNIIRPQSRLKFPIYIGPCVGRVFLNNLDNEDIYYPLGLQAKARVKYYLTRKFGLYAGVTGQYTFCLIDNDVHSLEDFVFKKSPYIGLEAGIMFDLK